MALTALRSWRSGAGYRCLLVNIHRLLPYTQSDPGMIFDLGSDYNRFDRVVKAKIIDRHRPTSLSGREIIACEPPFPGNENERHCAFTGSGKSFHHPPPSTPWKTRFDTRSRTGREHDVVFDKRNARRANSTVNEKWMGLTKLRWLRAAYYFEGGYTQWRQKSFAHLRGRKR